MSGALPLWRAGETQDLWVCVQRPDCRRASVYDEVVVERLLKWYSRAVDFSRVCIHGPLRSTFLVWPVELASSHPFAHLIRMLLLFLSGNVRHQKKLRFCIAWVWFDCLHPCGQCNGYYQKSKPTCMCLLPLHVKHSPDLSSFLVCSDLLMWNPFIVSDTVLDANFTMYR